jgi:peptidoglycan/LPS O-acetylase OafA/YrhL
MNRQPTDPALQKDYPHKPPAWIAFVLDTPIYIIMAGNFWVFVFFILSGFVLPLSWFRTRKPESITGAVFRRYIRLMIPYFITISFYYFVAKMDLTWRKKSLAAVKKKSFL